MRAAHTREGIQERGTEERTLTRQRRLSEYETARFGAALRYHALADAALRTDSRDVAWKHLVEGGWNDPSSAGLDSLRARARVLQPAVKATTLEASSPRD